MPMYHGDVETREVHCGERLLNPAVSQKIVNHSPDGFAWGYSGSGPAQLALAILLDMGLTEQNAEERYQEFKRDFIQPLAVDADFDIHSDAIAAWNLSYTANKGVFL